MSGRDVYDYIIVGAGSAGCVMANRLSADQACRVLLVEAGGWDRDPIIHIPLGWGRILLGRLHDWGYFAEPAEDVGKRAVECARGKVVGGSSSVNAMAYVRGHRADYDRWAAEYGLADWSYDRVLPYFRRQESWERGADAFRGGDGPLTTQECRYRDPLIDAYLQAASEAGHPRADDYNGAEQEGVGLWQMTIRNGRRCSAAVAYLRPALKRRNLRIVVRAQVHRVVMERGRAVGIRYRRGDRLVEARADSEVILCGGTINTPQLMMLSGLGPAKVLSDHGIAVQADLPGVGENYQDHMSAAVVFARTAPGPLHPKMRADRVVPELARAYFAGRGMASDLPAGLMAFLRTSPAEPLPDVQLMLNSAPLTAKPYLAPFVAPYADGFAVRVVGLRPFSRGRITLRSSDPEAAPRIDAGLLSDPRDLRPIRDALRIAREITAQPALAPYLKAELAPGPDATSDDALDDHIRATGLTVHHPAGTCRMGGIDDPMAVVGSDLRVRGVDALRIVDASAMPDLVGGNINAAVIMIAEKAADAVLGRAIASGENRKAA